MKLGVISDTHVPSRMRRLPPRVLQTFVDEEVETILHAGDIERADVLTELEAVAPVVAVRGNMDRSGETAHLPQQRVIDLAGRHIALCHGWGAPQGIVERILDAIEEPDIDLLVYGHTHHPHDDTVRGVRVFNPGSASINYFHSSPTVGIIVLNDEIEAAHYPA